MRIALTVHPGESRSGAVTYRWDADTDILAAEVAGPASAVSGLTGVVEVEGRDGSWLNIDVRGGELIGVEVAVWPEVKIVSSLVPAAVLEGARVSFPAQAADHGVASIELESALAAEADKAERTVHFRIGQARAAATYRAGADLLIEVDDTNHLAGIWLLNVPPFPGSP